MVEFEDQAINNNPLSKKPLDEGLKDWELFLQIWCHCTLQLRVLTDVFTTHTPNLNYINCSD